VVPQDVGRLGNVGGMTRGLIVFVTLAAWALALIAASSLLPADASLLAR
jgi:hypothetical protein